MQIAKGRVHWRKPNLPEIFGKGETNKMNRTTKAESDMQLYVPLDGREGDAIRVHRLNASIQEMNDAGYIAAPVGCTGDRPIRDIGSISEL
jgi:hypothetical protein